MSVQRIDNPARRTHGWQARVHKPGGGRMTRFVSDASAGGMVQAYDRAVRHERRMAIAVRKGTR